MGRGEDLMNRIAMYHGPADAGERGLCAAILQIPAGLLGDKAVTFTASP
jgi:hypothetical protein